MGDVLLTTPLLRMLRARFPDARIDVACAQEYADVFAFNPWVNHVVRIDKTRTAFAPLWNTIDQLASHYDVVIDTQRNLRSTLLSLGRGTRTMKIEKYRREKLKMVRTHRRIALPHVAERYVQCAEALGIVDDGLGLELWLPADDQGVDYMSQLVTARSKQDGRQIAMAPGAQHQTKRWPALKFAELARTLMQSFDVRIVLIGSTAERDLCGSIVEQCGGAIRSVCGASLAESAGVLDQSVALVSNDSGAMHVAAARHTPLVAIFGSTVPELGFAPFRSMASIVQQEMECRPCTHIGRASCPLGHMNCLNSIRVADVQSALSDVMRLAH